MNSKRIFLIHGWGGYPEEGWRPWLAENFRTLGHEVEVLKMPDTQHPKIDAWLKTLETAVGTPDEQCVFVGHSLGCITILRYLQKINDGKRVGGCVFVAGFYEDLGKGYEEIYGFFEEPIDWDAIHNRCTRFAVVHSQDDTVVALPFAERLASHLQCTVQLTSGKKHFSGDDGITEAPEILSAIQSIL